MATKNLFEYFLGLIGQVKLYHFSTMKYSTHKTLDDFHENLGDLVDKLLEVYIGRYNKQPLEIFEITMKANTDINNLLIYLETEREVIRGIRNKTFKTNSEIQNIIDEIIALFDRTIYLCKLD
jgi:hypothetical protein